MHVHVCTHFMHSPATSTCGFGFPEPPPSDPVAPAAMWRPLHRNRAHHFSHRPPSLLCLCWGDPSPPCHCFLYYLCPAVVYKLFKSFLGTDKRSQLPRIQKRRQLEMWLGSALLSLSSEQGSAEVFGERRRKEKDPPQQTAPSLPPF